MTESTADETPPPCIGLSTGKLLAESSRPAWSLFTKPTAIASAATVVGVFINPKLDNNE